jgi:hypothetical protein
VVGDAFDNTWTETLAVLLWIHEEGAPNKFINVNKSQVKIRVQQWGIIFLVIPVRIIPVLVIQDSGIPVSILG